MFASLFALQYSFPGHSEVKASASNAGDLDSIPGSGRSPGEGNGNPLQYSCLEKPLDRGAGQATVHGVAKSRTRLSEFTFTVTKQRLTREKETSLLTCTSHIYLGFPGGSNSIESVCKAGVPDSIPGSGRSPREGNGNPLQYPCLENPMNREAWWATILGVSRSRA